jgi:hypothetical protein
MRCRLGRLGWAAVVFLVTACVLLSVVVDRSVERAATDSVRSSFTGNFSTSPAGFGAFLGQLSTGLRLTADAVSTHPSVPDVQQFVRVRVGLPPPAPPCGCMPSAAVGVEGRTGGSRRGPQATAVALAADRHSVSCTGGQGGKARVVGRRGKNEGSARASGAGPPTAPPRPPRPIHPGCQLHGAWEETGDGVVVEGWAGRLRAQRGGGQPPLFFAPVLFSWPNGRAVGPSLPPLVRPPGPRPRSPQPLAPPSCVPRLREL